MNQTQVDREPLARSMSEPEARGPEDFDGRLFVRLVAVSDGFCFVEREMNQELGESARKYRSKTDKRCMIPPSAITRTQGSEAPLMKLTNFMRNHSECMPAGICGQSS